VKETWFLCYCGVTFVSIHNGDVFCPCCARQLDKDTQTVEMSKLEYSDAKVTL